MCVHVRIRVCVCACRHTGTLFPQDLKWKAPVVDVNEMQRMLKTSLKLGGGEGDAK